MTYADIVNWMEKNLPIEFARDSFSAWFDKADSEFLNSGHFMPTKEILPLAKKKWLSKHDKLEPEGKAPPTPPEPKLPISRQLSNRFEKLPSGTEFNTAQIAQWTGFNKNTVRRELGEFAKEGTIQRIEKGRYRII